MIASGDDLPVAEHLVFPITPYQVKGYRFGQRVRSRVILWARHLGEDVIAKAGTPVVAIGQGKVVWSEVRAGSEEHRNWGGIVIIGHRSAITQEIFYSLYGHVTDRSVQVGDIVHAGQRIAVVATGHTPENGWWKQAHLHFGIYAGPWMGQVLPGYARPFEGRTKFSWWKDPQQFISAHTKNP